MTYVPEAPGVATDLNTAFVNGQPTADLTRHLTDLSAHHFGDANRLVRGKWDGQDAGYIGEARNNGGIFFYTGDDTWNAMEQGLDSQQAAGLTWRLNESFLATQMEDGLARIDCVVDFKRFSSLEDVLRLDSDSFSAKEIRYLFENAGAHGYERVGNSWVRIKGG
ncbi:hypothetical protein [Mycolicibacterium gadium]|uniref:Uncharacterized protein n=1 Tax=Mycolicibacterium gadium TaxID=1794 RepID=A0A7I7WQ42_MYCGU|nr:hypothetical protein [Mycolicibacterium gadium]BBZ18613.1 hypothetical protein MGAD_29480 [Mycolicibacterium gadium]